MIELFEAGARDPWQRPREVVDAIAPTGTVIDLGAGTGYFARYLAERARVIAVEPDPLLRARLASEGFAVADRIGAVDDPVDAVFAANVLRFLSEEERRAIADLTRRVVLLDWRTGPRPVGPPKEDAMEPDLAIRAFPRFRLGPTHDFLPYQWMVELERVD